MLRDRPSYFNLDVRSVQTVPQKLIDGIETKLPTLLAQTPAEDLISLYLKYHTKAIDMQATQAQEHAAYAAKQQESTMTNQFNQDLLSEFKRFSKDITSRLNDLEEAATTTKATTNKGKREDKK